MIKKYEFKSIALENLEVVDYNPNEMTKSQMDHLRKTIKERGFMQPLVVTPKEESPRNAGKYTVIDGAHRLEVFKELKRPAIPCYIVPDKKPLDIKIDLVNLNKIKGEFNQDKYNQLLDSIMKEVDLNKMKELMLLEKEDLKSFEKFLSEKNKIDLDPETIEVSSYERAKSKTKIQLGDIYQLGNHRLMCGDSTKESNVKSLMNGKQVDLLLTDPPYGVDYSSKNEFLNKLDKGNRIQEPIQNDNIKDYEAGFSSWLSLIKFNDYNSFYITISDQKLLELSLALKEEGYKISQHLVWIKNNHVLGRQDYANKHEFILYGWKDKHKFYGDFNTTTINIDRPIKSELHPTTKPTKLFSLFLLNSSKKDMIVLDLFGGSGTSIMSCEQYNRICFMMEIDPVYCQVIIDRWQDYTGKTATKITKDKGAE